MQQSNGIPPQDPSLALTRHARCPALGCGGVMRPDRQMACLEGTGLEPLRCPSCGHRGFRPHGDVQVLFGGRHEHVCSYGPSTLTLTIIFSGAALVLFGERGLAPSPAAAYAARWALLNGQVAGSVQMFLESPALARCHAYLVRYGVPSPNEDLQEVPH